jgi:Cof subfamily protein (haloacid dehalogenase superfamily)
MPIKMIVTDLDNTLLRRDKTISHYTADVFHRLQEKEVLIAFATARYFRTVEEWIIPSIGIHPDIVISLNGAYAYRNSEVLYKATIFPDLSNTLVRAIREQGGKIAVGTGGVRLSERQISDTHMSFTQPFDFSENLTEEVHFVDFHGSSEIADEIASIFPEIRVQKYVDASLITFLHKNAWKGVALAKIMERLGITSSEVAGFGDDNNDIDFLKNCGIKIAVNNAVDDVKSIVDCICDDCDNDGVAKWLEKNV